MKFGLLSAFFLLLTAAKAQTEDAFEKYSEGVKAFYAGEYETSLKYYNEALQQKPGMIPALLNRGLVYVKLDNHAAAQQDFRQITVLDSNFVDAWYYYGKSLMDLKQYDSAALYFQRALRITETHARSLKQLGIYYYYRKKYKEAIACYSKIIDSDTADDDVYYLRALAYKQLSRYAEAVNDQTMVIERNRSNTQALSERADCYLKMNELEKACSDFRQLEKLGDAEAAENITKYCTK